MFADEVLQAGTYTITITDNNVANNADDFPREAVGQVPPLAAASIVFTLHAVTDTAPTATLTFADSAAGNLKQVKGLLIVGVDTGSEVTQGRMYRRNDDPFHWFPGQTQKFVIKLS